MVTASDRQAAAAATSRARPGVTTTQASVVPSRARTRLTPPLPTYGSAFSHGVSAVAYASRPQGMPPNGQPDRTASIATHATADPEPARTGSRARTGTIRPEEAVERAPPAPTAPARRPSRPRASRTSGRSRTRCRRRGPGARPGGPAARARDQGAARRRRTGCRHEAPTGSNARARTTPETRAEKVRRSTGAKVPAAGDLQALPEGSLPFGPTRDRLAAETGKLSRGRGALPYPPSRSENRPPRTMSRMVAPHPPTQPLGRRSAGHDLHERTGGPWIVTARPVNLA